MGFIEELKSIAGVFREAGKIDQYKQIVDALQKISEIQAKLSVLETENQILKSKLDVKDLLLFKNNSYWIKEDGPYCSCCWDDERKTIRMQPCGNPAFYDCPKCKNKGVEIYPEKNKPQTTSVYIPDNLF